MAGIVAIAQITIAAPASDVWAALTEPTRIKEYMFGSTVVTDWRPGSLITWTGEYNGQRYQDKGQIIAVEPLQRLEVSRYSPMSGAADIPENYHRLTYQLATHAEDTRIELTQDNNPDEDTAAHASQNWLTMLAASKRTSKTPRHRQRERRNAQADRIDPRFPGRSRRITRTVGRVRRRIHGVLTGAA